jgi:muramoyltetrapeptide carboxypeptidase LdcA involved in peptidoglycan recycling
MAASGATAAGGSPSHPWQGLEGWRGGHGAVGGDQLTVATALIGTPWFPSLRGCVLGLEDVGEDPYRVDRMLTQWRSAGLLQQVAGIGVGRLSWSPDEVLPGDPGLEEVLRDRLGDLALPLGWLAHLDGSGGQLAYCESRALPPALAAIKKGPKGPRKHVAS